MFSYVCECAVSQKCDVTWRWLSPTWSAFRTLPDKHITGIPNGLSYQCVSRYGLKNTSLSWKIWDRYSCRPLDVVTAVSNNFLTIAPGNFHISRFTALCLRLCKKQFCFYSTTKKHFEKQSTSLDYTFRLSLFLSITGEAVCFRLSRTDRTAGLHCQFPLPCNLVNSEKCA
jgi:hypothetical protein